jgi:hypothetical protein
MSIALTGLAMAGNLPQEARPCGVQTTVQSARNIDELGGIHITAQGTLRVLIVFASFPDDEKVHPYWPAHKPPQSMDQFIDSDTTVRSQSAFNLTNYFNQMSMGQFHVVGDAVWVESWHSQSEYSNGSYGRANWSVLQESVDPIVDFSKYDNWTNQSNHANVNAPDSLVDMIIMVWRTTVFDYVGEASLGYKTGFVVDGKRIEMGFPERTDFPRGSGVTCEYTYGDDPERLLRTMVHEIGHWLLGGAHPYNSVTLGGKHQYWGMLCAGQRVSSCANAYERERLGWITVPEIAPDVDISLPDYLTWGVALKHHPANGDPFEYFYLENHQQLSPFDDVTSNQGDKGLWILHQQGPYIETDNLKISPSDGNWNWQNPGLTTACFSTGLPIFTRGEPGVLNCPSHRDQIPTNSSAVSWMLAFRDPAGGITCGSFFAGEAFNGAFSTLNSVFSPYSNPGSNTWNNQPSSFSLEVLDNINGTLIIRRNSDPLEGSPARRYLGVDPAATGMPRGQRSLAWGTQWADGQPLEADVVWSELQRQIGDGGEWDTVYQGPATSWTDGSLLYDTAGTIPVRFRVRVRDTQGKSSVWSNPLFAAATEVSGMELHNATPDHFGLGPNYPNPFNPTTVIRYEIATASRVTLKVYDLLGREVATLANEQKPAGSYSVTFDGSGLASGIYVYRLTAGDFFQVRNMVVVK